MHMQNTSHAVMAQRAELKNSLDDFPTPPWATRALIEHVVVGKSALSSMTCLEPACGRGHMGSYFIASNSFSIFALCGHWAPPAVERRSLAIAFVSARIINRR